MGAEEGRDAFLAFHHTPSASPSTGVSPLWVVVCPGVSPNGEALSQGKKSMGKVKVSKSDSDPGFRSWIPALEMWANLMPNRVPVSI